MHQNSLHATTDNSLKKEPMITSNGNNIEIDISKNDKLKEIFSRKELGHICTLEIKFQVNEKNENVIKGSLKKIAYEGDGEPVETEPMADQPVMVMIKPGKEKKTESAMAYGAGY